MIRAPAVLFRWRSMYVPEYSELSLTAHPLPVQSAIVVRSPLPHMAEGEGPQVTKHYLVAKGLPGFGCLNSD